jgi:phage shock protein C
MEKKRLTKSSNKMLAGVCAGLAEYLGWDVTAMRVVYVLASIFLAGFPGVLLYIILALIMPEPWEQI